MPERRAVQVLPGSMSPGVNPGAMPGQGPMNARNKSMPRVVQAHGISVAAPNAGSTSPMAPPPRRAFSPSPGTPAVPFGAAGSPGVPTSRGFSPPPPHVVGGRHMMSPAPPPPPVSPFGARRTLPPGALSNSLGHTRGGIQELLRSGNMSPGQAVQMMPLYGNGPPPPLSMTGPARAPHAGVATAVVRSTSKRDPRPGRDTPIMPTVIGPDSSGGDACSMSAPSGTATPAVPAKLVSAFNTSVVPPQVSAFNGTPVMPPQVSAALWGGMRTTSPQRSTLPPSWAPRRSLNGAESPLPASARVTAVARIQSAGLGASTAGSPLTGFGRRVPPVVAKTLDGRVRSCSPDGHRAGVVVFGGGVPTRTNVSTLRSSSPVWQEDVNRLPRDLIEYTDSYAVPAGPPLDNDPLQLEAGIEICLGDHQLRCLNVLGSGSYSIVWRAEVLGCMNNAAESNANSACRGQGSRMLLEKEVALKDVLCRSNAVLRQSLFEVQLLLALERRVLLDIGPQPAYPLRLPRCFAYKVDSREEGWRVRTAMTRLPGEQLDDWLRRAAVAVTTTPDVAWTSQLHRGCVMAEALVRQIGPTLQRLAPLAWHRDVNSHNVLVSDGANGKLLNQAPEDHGAGAEFWLIDLGLAVDARSWVSTDSSQGGTWRVTDIGGDCRYWPASSWMVHLYGADFLAEREDFCRQYQWRLDSFGLGITAVELICSTALAARLSGAAPVECESVSDVCWARLLDSWQRYYDKAGNWWAEIYKVFSSGGDFRPVHAWLVEEQVADQVVALMEDLREGLRSCMACSTDECSARVLGVVAELIDESSDYELVQLCAMFPGAAEAVPPVPNVVIAPTPPVPSPAQVVVAIATPAPPAIVAAPKESPRVAADAADACVVEALPCPADSAEGAVVAAPAAEAPVAEGATATEAPAAEAAAPAADEEAASLASNAAAEGRQALASLPPIPPIAAVEHQRQSPGGSRQAELAQLVEAQAQLRHDLERLQLAKMRLQQARRVHEHKKQSGNADAEEQGDSQHRNNGSSDPQGPALARGRSR